MRPHGCPSISRPVLVKSLVRIDLVSDLSPSPPPAELPPELETRIPVNANLSAIDGLEIETVDCLLGLVTSRILNEAETAGSLLNLVQTHYQVHHLPTLPKELKQLALVCVER